MSAYPPFFGLTVPEIWPTAQGFVGMSAVPVGHAVDLTLLFPNDDRERSDALAVEIRRHLGGCLMAVEMSLRLIIDQNPALADALRHAPDLICWPTVCAHPTLIAPPLPAHMRLRAGVSLMLREHGRSEHDGGDGHLAPDLLEGASADMRTAESMLAVAEGRWAALGGEDQPMRADLPAEHFAELTWTAVACLAVAVQHGMGLSQAAILDDLDQAARALLARHDEAAGPIGSADRLAHLMGVGGQASDIFGLALGQRQLLLFAALAARHLRVETIRVVEILVVGAVEKIAALCAAVGGTGADLRHLLLVLAAARPSLTDGRIVAEAERYDAVGDEQAAALIAELRAPFMLRSKLSLLRQAMAA